MITAEIQRTFNRWLYEVHEGSEVLDLGELGASPLATAEDLVHLLKPRWPNLKLSDCLVLRGPEVAS